MTSDSNTKALEAAKELSELFAALESVRQIDMDKVYIESTTAAGRYFTQLEQKRIEARLRGAKASKGKKLKPDLRTMTGRKKQHWATKRKKVREYVRTKRSPRQLRRKHQLIEAEGWYQNMVQGWLKQKLVVEITKEEWDEHIQPLLGDKYVPFTERYNPRDPVVSLDRIMIFDREAKGRLSKPLFDGKEWYLKERGYIL